MDNYLKKAIFEKETRIKFLSAKILTTRRFLILIRSGPFFLLIT
jgi:hypothetical protein